MPPKRKARGDDEDPGAFCSPTSLHAAPGRHANVTLSPILTLDADYEAAADAPVEAKEVKKRQKTKKGAVAAPLPAQVGEEDLPVDEDEILSEDEDYTRARGEFFALDPLGGFTRAPTCITGRLPSALSASFLCCTHSSS